MRLRQPVGIAVISHTERALLGYGAPLARDLDALDITKDIDALDITFVTRQGLWREHPSGVLTRLLIYTWVGPRYLRLNVPSAGSTQWCWPVAGRGR